MKLKQNKQSKLVIALSAVILLLVALSATLTFAYFTGTDNKSSGELTFGELKVALGESVKVTSDHTPLVPGCSIDVNGTSVKLLAGSNIEAFVRLKVEVGFGNGVTMTENTDYTVNVTGDWTESGDYFYYTGQGITGGDKHIGLANKDTAFNLNTIGVKIKESVSNDLQGKTVTVTLTVEVIQADHTVTFAGSDTTAFATAAKIATATAWEVFKSSIGE